MQTSPSEGGSQEEVRDTGEGQRSGEGGAQETARGGRHAGLEESRQGALRRDMATVDVFPLELQVSVLQQLGLRDRLNMGLVSKSWHEASLNSNLWRDTVIENRTKDVDLQGIATFLHTYKPRKLKLCKFELTPELLAVLNNCSGLQELSLEFCRTFSERDVLVLGSNSDLKTITFVASRLFSRDTLKSFITQHPNLIRVANKSAPRNLQEVFWGPSMRCLTFTRELDGSISFSA